MYGQPDRPESPVGFLVWDLLVRSVIPETNISKLSPTHFVSNIRHQHRWLKIRLSFSGERTAFILRTIWWGILYAAYIIKIGFINQFSYRYRANRFIHMGWVWNNITVNLYRIKLLMAQRKQYIIYYIYFSLIWTLEPSLAFNSKTSCLLLNVQGGESNMYSTGESKALWKWYIKLNIVLLTVTIRASV